MWTLLCALLLAAPADPQLDDSAERLLRAQRQVVILGGADRSSMHRAMQLKDAPATEGWYPTWSRVYGAYMPEDLVLDGGYKASWRRWLGYVPASGRAWAP